MREKILACFQWERFDFAFRPFDEMSQELPSFRCPPVEALVLEGIRTHFDAERLRPVLRPHAERFPVIAGDPGEVALRFRMSATEQRFVHRIDGTRSLAALRRDGPLDSLHAGQLLAALTLSHYLSLRETAARATRDAAEAWVEAEGLEGDIVTVGQIASDATDMWRSVVDPSAPRSAEEGRPSRAMR